MHSSFVDARSHFETLMGHSTQQEMIDSWIAIQNTIPGSEIEHQAWLDGLAAGTTTSTEPLLIRAILSRDIMMAQFLLIQNLDIQVISTSGKTALFFAASYLDAMNNPADAIPEFKKIHPLPVGVFSGAQQFVVQLIKAGGDVHTVIGGRSLLMLAVDAFHMPLAIELLDRGALFQAPNADEKPLAFRAFGDQAQYQMAVNKDPVLHQLRKRFWTHLIKQRGKSEIEAVWPNGEGMESKSPILHAVRNGNFGDFKILLEEGANVDALTSHHRNWPDLADELDKVTTPPSNTGPNPYESIRGGLKEIRNFMNARAEQGTISQAIAEVKVGLPETSSRSDFKQKKNNRL